MALVLGLNHLWTKRLAPLLAILATVGITLAVLLAAQQARQKPLLVPPPVVLAPVSPEPLPAAPPKGYVFEAHGDSPAVLRLYNTATKQTVWTGSFRGYGSVYSTDGTGWWSADRRAIAIPVQIADAEGIYFWREGHKIWFWNREQIKGVWDYVFDEFVWSADHHRVLFRIGASGAADVNVGGLCCADIKKKRVTLITMHGIRQMQWKNNNTFAYWPAHYDGKENHYEIDMPLLWHCP